MTGLPPLLQRDRIVDAVLLPLLGIAQAAALGLAAFATRDAFAALHTGGAPASMTLAALAAAGTLAAACDLLARWRAEALGQSYARDLRHRLYDHLAGMDRRDVASRRIGSLSLRFVGDLSAARLWFGRGLPQVWTAAIVLPGAGLTLWLLDPRLALAALVPLTLALGAMIAAALGLFARQERLRSRRSALSVAMMERIALAPDLDLIARTGRELDGLNRDGGALRDEAAGRALQAGILHAIPHVGVAGAGAATLWSVAAAELAPGLAAGALSALAILGMSLRDIGTAWDEWCAWRIALARAERLLSGHSLRRQIVPRGKAVAVTLEAVSCGTGPVSAAVPPGAVALLVGTAGSGKSRLAAVIAGLDRARSGQVLYDGVADPLPRIVHLGDSPVVLQGSLRRALTLGVDPRPSNGRITRAARSFGIDALLARDGGLMSRVGEAARSLSSGEALRLELARAALGRPDLVVIDSARFMTDPDRDALLALLQRKTGATIIVTAASGAGIASDVTVEIAPVTAGRALAKA